MTAYTVQQGRQITLPVEWLEYAGGPAAPVNGVTVEIVPTSGPPAVVGPTSTGVTNPAAGLNVYTWVVPVGQAVGEYFVIWRGTDAALDSVTATDTLTVVPAGADPPPAGQIIQVTDLPANLQTAEMVAEMVAGANAKAGRIAPCLTSTDPAPTTDQLAEARLILLGAVKRWAEAGAGAFQQQTAGPYSVTTDTRQRTGFNLWPSEIEALQALCRTSGPAAFTIDTAPGNVSQHSPICALNFGALYCSCGADLTLAGPLYEVVEP